MIRALRLDVEDRGHANQLAVDNILAAHLVGAAIRAMGEDEDIASINFLVTMMMMIGVIDCNG